MADEVVEIPDVPDAEYYACDDGERLEYDNPVEALEDWLDRDMTPGCNARDVLYATYPDGATIELRCFKREVVTDKWKDRMADALLAWLDEHYADEYADPDGCEPDKDAVDAAEPHVKAAVKAYCEKAHVWPCSQMAVVLFTAEQAEAFIRKHDPDWFAD